MSRTMAWVITHMIEAGPDKAADWDQMIGSYEEEQGPLQDRSEEDDCVTPPEEEEGPPF